MDQAAGMSATDFSSGGSLGSLAVSSAGICSATTDRPAEFKIDIEALPEDGDAPIETHSRN
jgi:hypothetical protein